ncbi:MAG: hypothetical protein ABSH00_08520 [Bryobacteraceae bacterium]|jgi:hypothetical protein
MRSHEALWGVLLLILCAVAAWPADISGQWKAEWAAGGGSSKQSTFTFKQEGTVLTGTISGEESELQIREGKVNGDDVSFVVAHKIGSREATMTYTGRLSGNEIKFKVSFPGTERTWDMTATKVP